MAPRKIIIDTDPGVDDVLAILLGLSSPELDVAAITICFGNTSAPSAFSNLLKIYHALENEIKENPEALNRYPGLQKKVKTVAAIGAKEPIAGTLKMAAYFHGADGLSNISETHPQFTPPPIVAPEVHQYLDISTKHASQVILDILKAEEQGTVDIVALGPLSNLALALKEDEKTFSRVGNVIWMGGALEVPGNTSATAEFNSYADPYAAQAILDGCEKNLYSITMAPLDITTPHKLHFNHLIHDISSLTVSPLQKFTTAMLLRVRGLMSSFGLPDQMELHDPVAVWIALGLARKEEGWKTQKRRFAVERTGEYTRGMCVIDRRGTGEESFARTEGELKDGTAMSTTKPTGNSKGLPDVVVTTPGSQTIEELLLNRVFGAEWSHH